MMTGALYRASIDDGRETFFEGRKVPNVAEYADVALG